MQQAMTRKMESYRVSALALLLVCVASPVGAEEAVQSSANQNQPEGQGDVRPAPVAETVVGPFETGTASPPDPMEIPWAPEHGESAESFGTAKPGNLNPQMLNMTPTGPGAVQGPPVDSGLVAYQPIPESLLPGRAASGAIQTSVTAQAPVPTTTNLGAPAVNWGPYTLGPDDVVHIVVRNQPEFTGIYAIGRDSKIQFGFIGDVEASGLTKEELARRIEQVLKRYVRIPSVTVTIVGFNSKAIYILGRVSRPGKYAMRGDSIKIRDAVIAAGLVVQHAKLRKVHIVKSDPSNPSFRVIDLQKVLYKGKMEENIDLVQGDIVVIPTTIWGGINDFLNGLLSPAGHAGSVAALAAL